MRQLLALLVLVGCSEPPVVVSASLPEHCATKTRAPVPPQRDHRTIDNVVAFARAAGGAANMAISERDICALDYARLRATCATKSGCIIPPKPL